MVYISSRKATSTNLPSLFKGGSYRTTASRAVNIFTPNKTCQGSAQFTNLRGHYFYHDPSNGTSQLLGDDWEPHFPGHICSDLPRTTVAMRKAYVDMPAVARLALICSYGNPPNLPPLDPKEQCSKRAKYLEKEKKCECKDPKKDARVLDPGHYGHYPAGIFCLDCKGEGGDTRAVAFVVDNSDAVPKSGWDRQKVWIKEVVDAVGSLHAAVIVMRRDSYVSIHMKDVSTQKWKSELDDWMGTHKWADDDKRHVGVAFRRAREELDKAPKNIPKYVVFVSDGGNDKCDPGWFWSIVWNECKGIEMDSSGGYEIKMANEIWEKGYKIVYIMVGNYYMEREHIYKKVEKVTKGFSNFIRVPRYDMIDASVTERVLNVVCSA